MSTTSTPLTKGYSTIIDEEDLELISQKSWHALLTKTGARANTNVKREDGYINVDLGRFLLGLKPGDKREVDHINRNTLDNRRCNLRIVTKAQNAKNKSISRDNTSGYNGAQWHKTDRKWRARIGTDGKQIFLGNFDTREDAAHAYNKAAKKYHGEFASLNEIEEKE